MNRKYKLNQRSTGTVLFNPTKYGNSKYYTVCLRGIDEKFKLDIDKMIELHKMRRIYSNMIEPYKTYGNMKFLKARMYPPYGMTHPESLKNGNRITFTPYYKITNFNNNYYFVMILEDVLIDMNQVKHKEHRAEKKMKKIRELAKEELTEEMVKQGIDADDFELN